MFLVLDREDESFRGKSYFPLVNRVFFETKKEALAWARKHPHFMMLRVAEAESDPRNDLIERPPAPEIQRSPTTPPSSPAKLGEWQKWGCVILEEAFVRAL